MMPRKNWIVSILFWFRFYFHHKIKSSDESFDESFDETTFKELEFEDIDSYLASL